MKQTEHPYWHRLYRCLEDFGTRYQNIPDFFKDRIQRYGILSLFILLFGSFMGTWMKDKTFIFWSFLLGIIGFIRTYLIFRTADKKTYEIIALVQQDLDDRLLHLGGGDIDGFMLGGAGIADTCEHVGNGIGDLHLGISSLLELPVLPGSGSEVPRQYMIDRGLSLSFTKFVGRAN